MLIKKITKEFIKSTLQYLIQIKRVNSNNFFAVNFKNLKHYIYVYCIN